MQHSLQQPSITNLVLIGGGHSHLSVIEGFGLNPMSDVRVILISKDTHTPYSGMLPGLVAGRYSVDESHIDLKRLCQKYNIDFQNRQVIDIDLKNKILHCKDGHTVNYDLLSINIGSSPKTSSIKGARICGTPIKPIKKFLSQWQSTSIDLQKPPKKHTIAIVGGGAAAVEMAFACHQKLERMLDSVSSSVHFSLICADNRLLPTYTARTRRYMTSALSDRGISVKLNATVTQAEKVRSATQLLFANGERLIVDDVIWAIHAGSPPWIAKTGLSCDQNGFINVNKYLQSLSHDSVFAAGDIAQFTENPIPKNGVYAVRAGQYLYHNLRRRILKQALKAYKPQRYFLSLLTAGDQYAIAEKGCLSLRGKWVWHWKDSIDRRFIAKFSSNGPQKDN